MIKVKLITLPSDVYNKKKDPKALEEYLESEINKIDCKRVINITPTFDMFMVTYEVEGFKASEEMDYYAKSCAIAEDGYDSKVVEAAIKRFKAEEVNKKEEKSNARLRRDKATGIYTIVTDTGHVGVGETVSQTLKSLQTDLRAKKDAKKK
jgi:hypothetical protein